MQGFLWAHFPPSCAFIDQKKKRGGKKGKEATGGGGCLAGIDSVKQKRRRTPFIDSFVKENIEKEESTKMNLPGILGYERDPKEDYYKILGCDRSSTREQILTEYKLRAKECHPDKHNTKESLVKFQNLQQVLRLLIIPLK